MITEKDLNCKAIKHSIYGNIVYGNVANDFSFANLFGADHLSLYLVACDNGDLCCCHWSNTAHLRTLL